MQPMPALPHTPAASLSALLARHSGDPHALVQILREAQVPRGWLPREVLAEIAAALGLTLAHVQGVAGFYRFFHTRPVGTYRVLFSNNITDRMLGNEAMMRDLCQRLGIARGQVRADGRVSVTTASCTGMCDQGPALLVNHQHIVTRLNPGRIEHIAAFDQIVQPLIDQPRRMAVAFMAGLAPALRTVIGDHLHEHGFRQRVSAHARDLRLATIGCERSGDRRRQGE